MALLTNSNVLNTPFTAAAGTFRVQCDVNSARLQSRGASGAAWCTEIDLQPNQSRLVDNPSSSTEYQFTAIAGTVTRADQ